MNFKSHASFGLLTALITYHFTSSITASLVMFFVQIGLILDFLFKWWIKFEPFHSIAGMLVVWLASWLLFPAHHWFVLIAYFTHLFLDVWVYEPIPLLWPSKKQLMFPIKNSEKFTILSSLILSALMFVVILWPF